MLPLCKAIHFRLLSSLPLTVHLALVHFSVCIFDYVCLISVCCIFSFILCSATIYDGEIKLNILASTTASSHTVHAFGARTR